MLNQNNDLNTIFDQIMKASEVMASEVNPQKKRRYIAEYKKLYDKLLRIIDAGEKQDELRSRIKFQAKTDKTH